MKYSSKEKNTMMKTYLLNSVIFLGILFSFINVRASHTAGTFMQIEVIGQDSFQVNMTMYRDCSGIQLGTLNVNLTTGCGNITTLALNQISVQQIDYGCITSTCAGGTSVGFEKYLFSAIYVNPSICGSLMADYSLCCRNTANNAVGQGNMYVEAKIYTTVVGESTPKMAADGMPNFCLSSSASYNPLAYDDNQDSIWISAVDPLIGLGVPISWQWGYTTNSPIQGYSLNGATGQVSANPSTLGLFINKMKLADYDQTSGQLKGYSTLDHLFVVQNCASTASSPVAATPSNLTNVYLNSAGEFEMCNSQAVTFDIVFTDGDASDSLSIISNLTQLFPGATGVVSGTNPMTYSVTIPSNTTPGSYVLGVQVSDNSCTDNNTFSTYPIKIISGTYASEDVTICAGDWVELNASGGTSFTWADLTGTMDTNPSSSGYNASCTNCASALVKPASTTQYEVTSNLSSTCGNVDTVTVTVAPSFTLAFPADTNFCGSLNFQLPVSSSDTTVSVSWSSNMYIDNDTILNPNFSTANSGAITLQAISSGGCERVETYNFTKTEVFPVGSDIMGDTLLCFGDTANLSVVLGEVYYDNCGTNNNLNQASLNTQVIGDLITSNNNFKLLDISGTNGNNGKVQFLFKKSELEAMGMMDGGIIESLGFNLNQTIPIVNSLTIGITCSSLANLNTQTENSFTEVYSGNNQGLSSGWNTFALGTPYIWNGEDAIVIQICVNNTSGWTSNTEFKCNNTNFVSAVGSYPIGVPNCQGAMFNGITGVARPITQFSFRSGINANQLAYDWIGISNTTSSHSFVPAVGQHSVKAVITNSAGSCVDTLETSIHVVSSYDPAFSYISPLCPNEAAQQLVGATPDGIFSGTGVSSAGLFDPAVSGAGIWPISYIVGAGSNCESDTTQFLVVNALPDASFDTITVCQGASAFNITPNTPGGVFYGPVTDSINGTFDPLGLGVGYYAIAYEVATMCTNRDTSYVRIVKPFQVSSNSNFLTVCQGEVLDVSGNVSVAQGQVYGDHPIISFSEANNLVDSNGIFDASNAVPGAYQVMATATENGTCSGDVTFTVQVLGTDQPEFTSSLTYCVSELTGRLEANPSLFGNGTQFTITPLFGGDTLEWQPLMGDNMKFNPSNNGVGEWYIALYYTNVNGCTAFVEDTLRIINTPDTSVAFVGNLLNAVNQSGYSYQWYRCDGTILNGETNYQLSTSTPGAYYVEVTVGNCTEVSGCHTINVNGMEFMELPSVSVYPNPVSNNLTLSIGSLNAVNVQIINASGAQVYRDKINTNKVIDMASWASGIYLLKVSSQGKQNNYTIIKE